MEGDRKQDVCRNYRLMGVLRRGLGSSRRGLGTYIYNFGVSLDRSWNLAKRPWKLIYNF